MWSSANLDYSALQFNKNSLLRSYSRHSLSRLPFISTFRFLDLSVPWAFQPPVGKNTLVNSTTRYLDLSVSRPSFAGPFGTFYHVISNFLILFWNWFLNEFFISIEKSKIRFGDDFSNAQILYKHSLHIRILNFIRI